MTVFYLLIAAALLVAFTLGYTAGFHDVGWRIATWRRRHRYRSAPPRPIDTVQIPDPGTTTAPEPTKET